MQPVLGDILGLYSCFLGHFLQEEIVYDLDGRTIL